MSKQATATLFAMASIGDTYTANWDVLRDVLQNKAKEGSATVTVFGAFCDNALLNVNTTLVWMS